VRINKKQIHHLQTQSVVFIVLFFCIIALVMWFAEEKQVQFDWTQNSSNTPSPAALEVLKQVSSPMTFKVFVSESNKHIRTRSEQLIGAFSRVNNNIQIEFIDPIKQPALAKQYQVDTDGTILAMQGNRITQLESLSEQGLVNAVIRASRSFQHSIVFLEGHKERSYHGESDLEYTLLVSELRKKGFDVQSVNLAASQKLPANTSVLVVADPRNSLLPGEVDLILDFLERGGNLLWLTEPNNAVRFDFLTEELGVELLPGIVVDPNSEFVGLSDPRFSLVAEYPQHPITQGFSTLTIFPSAQAFEIIENETWDSESFLQTLERSWVETEDMNSTPNFDLGQDISGPLSIGLSFSRVLDELDQGSLEEEGSKGDEIEVMNFEPEPTDDPKQQRVVILGDSDFIADAYIGQGGNMMLANNIFSWMIGDQTFVNIASRVKIDAKLDMSAFYYKFHTFIFTLLLPFILTISGFKIWVSRRNRT